MKYVLLILFTLLGSTGFSQDSLTVIVLSDKVGAIIDLTEKKEYFLFPYFGSKTFKSAWLFKSTTGEIILRAVMKNGKIKQRVMTVRDMSVAKKKLNAPLNAKEKKNRKNATIAAVVVGVLIVSPVALLMYLFSDI